jgi:MtN3 and saliva related transmembrane protein
MNIAHELLGGLAACLTTLAFLPQVIQVFKTRSARDISLPMYIVFVSGVVLWLVYGLLIGAWPVIIGNVVTLVLAGSVLIMKLRFG